MSDLLGFLAGMSLESQGDGVAAVQFRHLRTLEVGEAQGGQPSRGVGEAPGVREHSRGCHEEEEEELHFKSVGFLFRLFGVE
jgi:hypothetical protein